MANNPYEMDYEAWYTLHGPSSYGGPATCWSGQAAYTDGDGRLAAAQYGPTNPGGPVFVWSGPQPTIKVELFGVDGGGILKAAWLDINDNSKGRISSDGAHIPGDAARHDFVFYIDTDSPGGLGGNSGKFFLTNVSMSGVSIRKIKITFS